MSVDPYMERVQRRVLDENGHHDVPVEQFRYYSADSEWTRSTFTLDRETTVVFGSSPILPTTEQYADAERLLRGRGPLDADAALLRCWIADTKPLAVKAGWNDDPGDDWHELVNMLPSPCPSLWQRTPEWALAVGTLALLILLAIPVVLR